MQIFHKIAPLRAFLAEQRRHGKTIGLVPTMGALHEGHLSLISVARSQSDLTVATVFVNPAQFNNSSDLKNYPRTLEKDTELLEKVGCDVLFAPETTEIYPVETTLTFDFGTLDKVMEGKFRPGHFSGVALVVSKLFHIVEPDTAFFGQKDWQQFAVISRLVSELNFNIKLQSVPTFRSKEGLALSSRNMRLTPAQREIALVLYQSLTDAKTQLLSGVPVDVVQRNVEARFSGLEGVSLEYFEVADSANLTLLNNVKEAASPILCIAAFVGEVRLIDNMFLLSQHS